MPNINIALDSESFRELSALAIEQRRAISMQAEVLLLQALGRWPVSAPSTPRSTPQPPVAVHR
jgi:hypothetical protein